MAGRGHNRHAMRRGFDGLAAIVQEHLVAFKYIYDFGDRWELRIKVEKTLLGDPELAKRAMCLTGANAAPPDDVGGAPGYEEFVATMTNPNHPEHQQMLEWYGGSFDPTCFDSAALSLAYHDLKI